MRGLITSSRIVHVAPEHDNTSNAEVGLNENHQDNIRLSDLHEAEISSATLVHEQCNDREDLEGRSENNIEGTLQLEHYLKYLHYVGLASFQECCKKRPSAGCAIQKVPTVKNTTEKYQYQIKQRSSAILLIFSF